MAALFTFFLTTDCSTLAFVRELDRVAVSLGKVDESLVRAQEDLWTVEVMLRTLFVVLGVLRLAGHYLKWNFHTSVQ